MPKLDKELQQAIDAHPGEAVPVIDERTGTPYVLVPRTLYEQMKAALEEELDIRGAYPLMDAVARSEGWEDPDMDSYDVYARKPKP